MEETLGQKAEQNEEQKDAHHALIFYKSIAPQAGGFAFIFGTVIIACINGSVIICGMCILGALYCLPLNTEISIANKTGLWNRTQAKSITVEHNDGDNSDNLIKRISRLWTGGVQ